MAGTALNSRHAKRQKLTSNCGFTLVELLVVVTIISVLFGVLLPAIHAAREAARRNQCASNLKQIDLALLSYEEKKRTFPAGAHLHYEDAQPGISWRVLILPYIEQTEMYSQIKPRRNGGADNWSAQKTTVNLFICPSAPQVADDPSVLKVSQYCAIAGSGEARVLERITCGDVFTDGILYPDSRIDSGMIIDGASNTLIVGERLYRLRDWMTGAIKVGDPATMICMEAAKNVRYPINADQQQFGVYVGDTTAPAGVPKKMLLNDLQFGSDHPGGAQFCLADGSVQWLSDQIEFGIYQEMASRAGSPNQ